MNRIELMENNTLEELAEMCIDFRSEIETLKSQNQNLEKQKEYLLEKVKNEISGMSPKDPLTNKRILELEDRHQQDCITINRLSTTIDVLVDKLARTRDVCGI